MELSFCLPFASFPSFLSHSFLYVGILESEACISCRMKLIKRKRTETEWYPYMWALKKHSMRIADGQSQQNLRTDQQNWACQGQGGVKMSHTLYFQPLVSMSEVESLHEWINQQSWVRKVWSQMAFNLMVFWHANLKPIFFDQVKSNWEGGLNEQQKYHQANLV